MNMGLGHKPERQPDRFDAKPNANTDAASAARCFQQMSATANTTRIGPVRTRAE